MSHLEYVFWIIIGLAILTIFIVWAILSHLGGIKAKLATAQSDVNIAKAYLSEIPTLKARLVSLETKAEKIVAVASSVTTDPPKG